MNRYVVGLYGFYGIDGIPGRYKVNFKGNGFEDYTKYVTVGQELPAPPVADADSFYGWYDNPEFKGEPITKVTLWTGGEFTLWAKVGYPINYNLGSTRPEEFINYDELPHWYYCDEENPFKLDFTLEAEGLTFEGWEDSIVKIPEGGFTEMPGVLNLTPRYTGNTYDIYAHIYLEGHVDIVEKIGTYQYTKTWADSKIQKSLVTSLAPSVPGYVGGEVYIDPEFKEIVGVNSNYISTPYMGYGEPGDFHLYYKYVPMKYDITFDWGYEGAPEVEGILYERGVKGFKLPTEIPARIGYSFGGWNIVFTNRYGQNKNYPATQNEYDKYWELPDLYLAVTEVKFVAQWYAITDATISLVNSLTGVSTRYTFDPAVDYTMPEGPTELIKIGDVYYGFAGWYNNAKCEGEAVTVIKANEFDINNSKYYSKWVPVTVEEN